MRERPPQKNCQVEPSYPEHDTIVFSLRDPDYVHHMPGHECILSYPHKLENCGKTDPEIDRLYLVDFSRMYGIISPDRIQFAIVAV